MSATDVTLRTFEYHCTANGACHCDWRVTLVGCVESTAMKGINIGNIAVSTLAAVIGFGLLVHRVGIKGHRLFDISSGKGCLRPKPIDCMLLMLLIFNILRLLSSAILVSDAAHNMISRMFIFEFPWQFGYGGFALYLVGIAQTLADSHKAISSDWLPSARTVDIIGCTFFFGPFITNNIVTLVGGALARSNLHAAEICVRLLYVFWFIHCITLSSAVLFSGIGLVRILNRHLDKFQSYGPRYISVKTGIFKIRAVMGIIVVCLLSFAIFLLIYCILRDRIMIHPVGSIFLGAIWNLLGPITTLCVEITVMVSPNLGTSFVGGLKTSSGAGSGGGDKGYNITSGFGNGSFSSGEGHRGRIGMSFTHGGTSDLGTPFSGTLSQHHPLEVLKQQQMQYQQVFYKHYQRHHGSSSSHGSQVGANSSNDARMDNAIHMDDIPFYSPISKDIRIQQQQQTNNEKLVWLPPIDDSLDNDLSSQLRLVQPDSRRY